MQYCLWQCMHALHACLQRSSIGAPQIQGSPKQQNSHDAPCENHYSGASCGQNLTPSPASTQRIKTVGGPGGTLGGQNAILGPPGEIPKSTPEPKNPLLGADPLLFCRLFFELVSGSPPGSILGRFWEGPTLKNEVFASEGLQISKIQIFRSRTRFSPKIAPFGEPKTPPKISGGDKTGFWRVRN